MNQNDLLPYQTVGSVPTGATTKNYKDVNNC